MIRRTQRELVDVLTREENLKFKTFELVHEGEYAVDDADWNYKDVPHLREIHRLVESYPTWIEDKVIATVNVQKVLGVRTLVNLVNYESGKDRQTYHTTMGPFVLIIETSYAALTPLKTRVVTRYAIGTTLGWLLDLLFPLMRWSIARNYENLMLGDVPMRLRRGQIRKWGYEIIKRSPTYSFLKTIKVSETNVPPVEGRPIPKALTLSMAEVTSGSVRFFGESDHLGLQIHCTEATIEVFPRMCPHEGAELDRTSCATEKRVRCPWHGRMFQSLLSIPRSATEGNWRLPYHEVSIGPAGLRVAVASALSSRCNGDSRPEHPHQ